MPAESGQPRRPEPGEAAAPGGEAKSVARLPIPLQVEPPAVERPLRLGQAASACFVGVSPREWRRLDRRGAVPAPVRLGRRPLWSREELRRWDLAGCPPRERWEELRAAERRRGAR